MKIVAGILLAIVIIVAVNAVLVQKPKLKVLSGGVQDTAAGRGQTGFGSSAGQGSAGGGGGAW